MKVLLIDVNCKNSSTGNIVYNLYNYVNSLGNEASVCYGRGAKIKEKNIFKFGIDAETYLHALLTRITGFTGCFSFFSTKRLIKYIEMFKPDVVHIHELHAYFINIKPLVVYLKKNHIKTIMTLHCEFAYTGKCGHSVECEQWKSECKKCPHLKEYVSTLWFDHTKYMFNQKKELFRDFEELSIIAPSQWLANRAKESFLKNHPIKVVENGIDTSIFFPQTTQKLRNELGILQNEKVVLALAPHLMTKEKGGTFILELAKRMENEKVKFILVGVDRVENNIDRNVIIKGAIYDKSVLAKYYSLADCFVICSERENFPTTCLEAQACGTPVFGFDTGGTKETLVNNSFGGLVEYGDINSLANLILECPMKNIEISKNISVLAEKLYGMNTFLERNYMVYNSK